MVYMDLKKAELIQAVYAVLDGMDDPLLSPSSTKEAAAMSMDYLGVEVGKLYKLLMSKFPGKGGPKGENNGVLWKPIFHYAVNKLDRSGHDGGEGR